MIITCNNKLVSDLFKTPKNLVKLIAAVLLLVFVSCQVVRMIADSNKNRNVEIAVELDEVNDICSAKGYKLDDFLMRAAAIGVRSVVLKEETLSSLSASGRIVYFSNAEQKRLLLLDAVSSGSKISGNSIVVPKDPELSAQLCLQFKERYHINCETSTLAGSQIINIRFNELYQPSIYSENMPLGFLNEKIKYLQELGFNVVLKTRNTGNPKWLLLNEMPKNVTGVMCADKDVPGFNGNEFYFAEFIKKNRLKYISIEFINYSGENRLLELAPEKLLRGHTIPQEELVLNFSAEAHTSRIVRAIRERKFRFILFHFSPARDIENSLSFLRDTAQEIKKSGFSLAPADLPVFDSCKPSNIRLLLVFIVSILFPVLALRVAQCGGNYFKSFILQNMITLFGGMAIAGILFNYFYAQKIINVPGIKIIMAITIVLAAFTIYSKHDIKNFVNANIKIKHIALFGFAAAVISYMLMRAGNNNAIMLPFEKDIRQFLEDVFIARPRTKEFLIGQPALIVGYYYKNRLLLLIGIVGQVSIINTFLHPHIPFMTSLMRCLHGMWLGFILGMIIIGLLNFLREYKKA